MVYQPERISFEELLKVFWENHDPTQGRDWTLLKFLPCYSRRIGVGVAHGVNPSRMFTDRGGMGRGREKLRIKGKGSAPQTQLSGVWKLPQRKMPDCGDSTLLIS